MRLVLQLQMNGLFFIGNIILLWMMFRGVTNANLYGVNTFGKVMHSVISLCVVAFNAGTYGMITSTVNNWAYAFQKPEKSSLEGFNSSLMEWGLQNI